MNAETKWTPGPWTVIPAVPYDGDESEFEGAYTSPASIEGADGNPVCVFGSAEGSGSLFENEADYHLIAAAPDLFEALLALPTEWLNSGVLSSNDNRIDHVPIKMFIEGTTYEAEMTVGDLRRARAALLKAGG